MTRATVPAMDARGPWQRLGWALPWLLFLAFPVADLVATGRGTGHGVSTSDGPRSFLSLRSPRISER